MPRHVTDSYPPRTNYGLNSKKLDPAVFEFIVSVGVHIENAEKSAKLLLRTFVAATKAKEFGVETAEEAIRILLRSMLDQLRSDMYVPLLDNGHEKWRALVVTYRAYIHMLLSWTCVDILTMSPSIKSYAEKAIGIIIGSLPQGKLVKEHPIDPIEEQARTNEVAPSPKELSDSLRKLGEAMEADERIRE